MKILILKAINWIMAVLFIVAATALDSPSRIPIAVVIICEVWFVLFMLANPNMELKGE